MDTKESFTPSENQEVHQQTPEESMKIGEKVSSLTERMNRNPFSSLDDKTIQAIINTPSAHETDIQAAKDEAKRREDEGHFDPESSNVDIKQDLKDNYFAVNEGRFLIPTDEYKEYREGIKHGEEQDIMRGVVRETVEERQKRLEKQEATQNPEHKNKLADFRSEAEEYLRNEEHLKEAFRESEVLKYYPKDQAIQIMAKRISDINKYIGMERKGNETAARSSYYSYLKKALAADIIPDGDLDNQELKEEYLQRCAKNAIQKRRTVYREKQNYLHAVDMYVDIAKNSQNAEKNFIPLQKLETDLKKKVLESAISNDLASGTFLPNTSKNNPEAVRQYLAENEISSDTLHSGLLEYICETKKDNLDEELVYAYDDILDAKSAIVKGFTSNDPPFSSELKNKQLIKVGKDESGRFRARNGRLEKITAPAAEIINRQVDEVVEKISGSESYAESVEAAKQQVYEKISKKIK